MEKQQLQTCQFLQDAVIWVTECMCDYGIVCARVVFDRPLSSRSFHPNHPTSHRRRQERAEPSDLPTFHERSTTPIIFKVLFGPAPVKPPPPPTDKHTHYHTCPGVRPDSAPVLKQDRACPAIMNKSVGFAQIHCGGTVEHVSREAFRPLWEGVASSPGRRGRFTQRLLNSPDSQNKPTADSNRFMTSCRREGRADGEASNSRCST